MASRKLKIDMTGVESYTRCSEGEHLAKLKKIDMGTVQGSGDDCLKAVFEVIKGDDKGCQVFETFSLGEKALWKLKSFLSAIGMKADSKMTLDLDKLEGKICTIDVVHQEYNGSKRASISSYIKPHDDDDEYEDEIDEEDEEDEEEEAPVKKSSKSSSKSAKSSRKAEEDEDEDDEEEEAPKSKKSSKKAAPAKKSKKQPEPEEDDDDDWDEDDDD